MHRTRRKRYHTIDVQGMQGGTAQTVGGTEGNRDIGARDSSIGLDLDESYQLVNASRRYGKRDFTRSITSLLTDYYRYLGL